MIKEYEAKDYDAVVSLGQEITPDFIKLFNIKELSDQEEIFVYEEEGKVIGFVHILTNYDVLEILNLAIAPHKRRQGIGSVLVDHIIYLPNQNIKRILLEVRKTNYDAIRLYNKFNFFAINERPKYYGDDDAIIMERRHER